MNILLITSSCDSAGLWNRFKNEGHKVCVYFSDPALKESMAGVVEPVTLNEGLSKKPDFIWSDMVKNGDLCDRLKASGLPIFGGSTFCDDIELRRDIGMEVMKKAGIRIPETEHFSSIKEVKDYVSKRGKPVAIKCDGNVSAASSVVAHSVQEAMEYLEFLEESGGNGATKFLVQDVVKGVEISTEIWMCNGKVLYPLNSTFEEKKLMADSLGPNTGAMSSVVFPYLSSSPKIGQQTVLKMVPLLERLKFTGCLDINGIVSEEDHFIYALEFTARAGYDAIYALAAMIDSPLADFFHDLAHGTAKRVPLNHSWGAAIRVLIPPAPNEWPDDEELSKKAYSAIRGQIVRFPKDPLIYPIEEIGLDKKGRWETKGIDGTVAEACGVGRTKQEAWDGAVKRFKQVKVASAMGRLDGIKRVVEDSGRLRSWGYDILQGQGAALPPGRQKDSLLGGPSLTLH